MKIANSSNDFVKRKTGQSVSENALSCLLHLWVRCGQIPSVSRPYKLPVVLHPFWIGHFRHFLTKGILSHSLPFVKPLFKHFAKKQQKSFYEI